MGKKKQDIVTEELVNVADAAVDTTDENIAETVAETVAEIITNEEVGNETVEDFGDVMDNCGETVDKLAEDFDGINMANVSESLSEDATEHDISTEEQLIENGSISSSSYSADGSDDTTTSEPSAQPPIRPYIVQPRKGQLWVRCGAGLEYVVVGVIRGSEQLRILEEVKDKRGIRWGKTEVGEACWVNLSETLFIKLD